MIETLAGDRSVWPITDPDPVVSELYGTTTLDYALPLAPGDYHIVGLVGKHTDLDARPVSLPPFRIGMSGSIYGGTSSRIGSLRVQVPSTGCVFMGKLSVNYFRVSPGTRAEQEKDIDQIGRVIRDTVYYTYLRSGSVASKSAESRDLIPSEEWSKEATDRGCALKLTQWDFQ